MSDGTLYVVATPIGNLADISQRAIKVLGDVRLIAAEDTRVTQKLLQHLGISAHMLSLHEHNEHKRSEQLLAYLLDGQDIALVSDAGTPLISDPGYPLVRTVREAGIKVVPIPGPSAIISALSVAGLPTDRFVFEGFLPGKAASRRARLEQLKSETRTLVFYESPHRVLACIDDMQTCLGLERQAVVARELTKTFETIHNGTLQELQQWMQNDSNQQRGEFVLLVAGSEPRESTTQLDENHVLEVLLSELPVKQAASLAARVCKGKKNHFYQLALAMKEL